MPCTALYRHLPAMPARLGCFGMVTIHMQAARQRDACVWNVFLGCQLHVQLACAMHISMHADV